MKPRIIMGLLLAMTVSGFSAARADCDCCCRPCGPARYEGHRPGAKVREQENREREARGFARFVKRLGLTEAQKSKIEGILQAERDKSLPLRQKLEDTWNRLRQSEQAATFDEAVVRTIAASQAQLVTEMTVGHARMQNQINALLTQEQRAAAEKFRPPWEAGCPEGFPLPVKDCAPREIGHCGGE